jgi:hypothetical protein
MHDLQKVMVSNFERRVRVGRAPPDRTPCASRKSALEKSIRELTEKLVDEVIDPFLGTVFDSLGEAYDFYNLYSWGHGLALGTTRAGLTQGRQSACRRLCADAR